MMESSSKAIEPEGFASLVDMIGPDDSEVVAEILDTYIVESDDLVALIDTAWANNQLDEMLRPAHSMKSSSAIVGAMKLSATCAELEQFVRGHGPDLNVEEYVGRVRAEYAQARIELVILRDEYAEK